MKLTRSKQFLKDNAKILRSAPEHFNKDTTLMTTEQYENAKLRILVVFPSGASTKALSMTASVINDFVITKCPDVFVDFAYLPEKSDFKTYDKYKIPYALGSITGLDASHYDIVGFSISIMFEAITTAWILNTFKYCDRPIPLTWSERKDLPLSATPIIHLGGITSSVADILFGELGDGRTAFVDFIHLGEIHCAKPWWDHVLKAKAKDLTVQNTINTFWLEHPEELWLYQPQAYEVKFNEHNQIISNIRINKFAPELCEPYYYDEAPDMLGAARGIVMGNGVNAGTAQIFAANGCSRSGFCNFSVHGQTLVTTDKGIFPIEQLADNGSCKMQSAGVVKATNVIATNIEDEYCVKLKSGATLVCSLNHKWVRIGNKVEDYYTTEQVFALLTKGESFKVFRKIGNHFDHNGKLNLFFMEATHYAKLIPTPEYPKGQFYRIFANADLFRVGKIVAYLNLYGYDTNVTEDGVRAIIDYWPAPNTVVEDEVVVVTPLNSRSLMYDVVETDDHTVCYNSIITHNCHEGSYTGGWVEASKEQLHDWAVESRRYTAANHLNPYAFNINYLSDFRGALYDWFSTYPRVTFNNQRLEELGRDVEALKMMKAMGSRRMTAPLEGISERVRNNYLNKNLTNEALTKYLEYGVMMGAIDCKVGLIFTGFEEEQDWQEFWDFNMYWRKHAAELGGKLPLRYKFTLAVHYPHTPLYYLTRIAAHYSYKGDYIMPQHWNDTYYANDVRIKINGFKHSSFIEQALVDLGRYLTPWMYNDIIKRGLQANNFRCITAAPECYKALQSLIDEEHYFGPRDIDNSISIVHRIHIKMHSAVIYQARRIAKDGVNAAPVVRCLKTYEGCKVDCKANVFKDAPLKVLGDCHIDENGKLVGSIAEWVKGCRRCKDTKERSTLMLNRKIGNTKTADDITMRKAPNIECKVRFVVNRLPEYEVVSPRTTMHTTISKYFQLSDELLSMYWELVEEGNMYWQATTEIPYTVSGVQVFDAKFTDPKAAEIIKSLTPQVNASCKTVQVLNTYPVVMEDTIKKTDYNIWHFTSSFPAELWQYLCMNYEGEVKVEGDGMAAGMEVVKDADLKAPRFALGDQVEGYFAIPTRYNPWCYLAGLFTRRRCSVNKLLSNVSLDCVTTTRDSNISCLCGKEYAQFDLVNRKHIKLGRGCMLSYFVKKR